jgi:DNA-binding CsgD family transcriptional regulator
VLLAAGDAGAACVELRRAWVAWHELEAPYEAARVRLQMATGATNREIADALVISEHTPRRHLQNIFGKIDVSSRAAATAYAYEHGLV